MKYVLNILILLSVNTNPITMSPTRSRSGSSRERSRSRSLRRRSRSRTRSRSSRSRRRDRDSPHTRTRDSSRSRPHSESSRYRSRRDSQSRRDRSSRKYREQPLPVVEECKSDASSESSEDEFKKDEPATESREKKMKKVDTANPFSTFDRQTSNRKRYFVPSEFAKSKWLHIRDMDADGKYMSENNNKPDLWKNVAKSDKLVRKYSGDVFADTKLDDGLYSLVDKKETNDEKDLVKSQRVYGSIGHLSLKALEGYAEVYKKIDSFGNKMLGYPAKLNPAWTGKEDQSNQQYIWSESQIHAYNECQSILKEFQVDVSEPLSNITRIAASAFTNSLEKRREKVLSRIKKKNTNAATAINRIAPSAYSLFGGDQGQLEKVVKLTRDLTSTSNRPEGTVSGSSYNMPRGGGSSRGNRGGFSYGSKAPQDKGYQDKSGAGRGLGKFRGGNSHRGKKH